MLRRQGRMTAVVAVAMAAALWNSAAGRAQEAAPEGRGDQARVAAIRQTLSAIDAEVRKYGGSWEEWGQRLEPFREAVRKKTPPKNGLRIRGDEYQQILQNQIRNETALKAIVHFDRQLKARGIDLIVVPIPGKLSIYPDFIYADVSCDRMVAVAAKRMMRDLLANDVEVVDLFTAYRDKRLETQDKTPLYYYHEDTHWRNLAAQIAGEKIGDRLQRYVFVQKALAGGNRYVGKAEARITTKNNPDTILSVYDGQTGAYYPDEPGVENSPVVITGDSYSKYNCGQGAHLPAQVALHLGVPLTYESSEGLSSGVPMLMAKFQKEKNYLANRSVFVWTFVWMSFEAKGWETVNFGPEAQ